MTNPNSGSESPSPLSTARRRAPISRLILVAVTIIAMLVLVGAANTLGIRKYEFYTHAVSSQFIEGRLALDSNKLRPYSTDRIVVAPEVPPFCREEAERGLIIVAFHSPEEHQEIHVLQARVRSGSWSDSQDISSTVQLQIHETTRGLYWARLETIQLPLQRLKGDIILTLVLDGQEGRTEMEFLLQRNVDYRPYFIYWAV